MKASRFSEEPMIHLLQRPERDEQPISVLCREHGISEQTFDRWRKTFGYQARPESNTELTTQVAELARHAMIPVQASYPGHVWTYAFLHDRCLNGTPLKVLTVMDEFTREGVAIEAATWLEGRHWGVEIWHIRIGTVRSPGLEEGPSGSSPGQEGCAYRR